MKLFTRFLLKVCLVLSLSVAPAHALDLGGIYESIQELVAKGFNNFLGNFDYINIEGDTLGLDSGLIANAVVGISRTVERNPYPLGQDDQYLVKDTMRLGFRLGAGFVISGSASYVQEWTLVYPAESVVQGMFNDRFIVDLLLPYHIWKNKLPKNYVLVTESYLEGQARIKISPPTLLTIGSTSKLGRVSLNRTFIDHKSERSFKVFSDESKYTHLNQEIVLGLGFLDIPLMDAGVKKGKLNRYYLYIDEGSIQDTSLSSLVTKMVQKNDLREAEKLGAYRLVKTDFTHRHTYLSAFGMASNKDIFRTDKITIKENGTVEKHLQVESRNDNAWTIGLDSESHTSRIVLSGKLTDKGLSSPIAALDFRIQDEGLKKNEIKDTYMKFIQNISHNKNFFKGDENTLKAPGMSQTGKVFMEMKVYEEGLENLLKTSESTYWKMLAKKTKKSVAQLKDASSMSLQNHSRRRMRSSRVRLVDQEMARRMKRFVAKIKEARKAKDPYTRWSTVVKAIRATVYQGLDSFRPTLLSVLTEIIEKENYFMTSQIVRLAAHKNHQGAKDLVLQGKQGRHRAIETEEFRFFFENATDIYFLF